VLHGEANKGDQSPASNSDQIQAEDTHFDENQLNQADPEDHGSNDPAENDNKSQGDDDQDGQHRGLLTLICKEIHQFFHDSSPEVCVST